MFIKSRIYLDDEFVVMTRNYFLQYTQLAIPEFRDTLIQHMGSVKKSIDERAQHKQEYDNRVNERQMQTIEEKVDSSKALNASLVDTKSSETESKEQDTSSRSGNDAHADDADIRPIYDEEPMAKDQNNEPSSSKLVPKVVPPADKTATSRQELELLFHHHITMMRLQLGPEQQRYKRWCCSLIPAESDSLPHAHTQATKTYYKHKDSRINKAQELNTKTSANSDIQDLPKSYQDYQDNDCQGRLLESFQGDTKYEYVGQDTR
ncbi:hypothetical protein Tco_0899519 [Tanacetum coccineum]